MVDAPGVQVPPSKAEATRRRLADEGILRTDLHVLETEGDIVFPVEEDDELDRFEFAPRDRRPRKYTDLLDWSAKDLNLAPRAFDTIGDIAIVKVPDALWDKRESLGRAMRAFLDARAVFHDRGVQGEFRVRELERIAGEGDSATVVQENGVELHVDVAKAYFSPRLATERDRVAQLTQPGEHVVDLFGGVAPFAVQAAKRGARVTSVDLNPDAHALALQNAAANRVELELHCGDARAVAQTLDPADRIVMNLPHGAKHFLDVARTLSKPGTVVHYHEIMADAEADARGTELEQALGGRLVTKRHVRNYAKTDSHWVFDVEVAS